jgi:hypothetical protein
MNTMLRFVPCLLLAAMLSPVPVNVAQDNTGTQLKAGSPTSSVRQFSAEELSVARKALADLTPEQRTLLNHLRYLLRPQYEDELMAGRAFAPCPLPPFEQPGVALESPDVLRLWAVLASGMPVTESTKGWLRLFIQAPVPAADDGLGELGVHMAVCAHAVRRAELGLGDELIERAEDLLDAAHKAKHATADNSPLIVGKVIDPKWYANQLWRALICRFALEMKLNTIERGWERAVHNLLAARDKLSGWRSKPSGNSEAEDLDSNLFSIAALSLAATAPEGVLGKAVARDVDESLQIVPGVLKRLDADFAGAALVGSRLAIILSLGAEMVPEGSEAETWRQTLLQRAMDSHDPSGVVREGAGRELGLTHSRYSLRVCETALECVALCGGLMGTEAPLAGMSIAGVGRALHACSVLHANGLPEGTRRVSTGHGHDLPKPQAIENFMLDGIEYLVEVQHADGGWGSAWTTGSGPQAATYDPGTTAFVAMALMRAGHTPFTGEHKNAVLKATKYIVGVVEDAREEGATITGSTGTQLQRKLGQIVDTAVVTQFLARVLHTTESDRALYASVEAALVKCIRKIESSQDKDGGWITAGWAPVLQSAMFNQALELAEVAGCEVDSAVLERSCGYLARDVEVDVDSGEGHSVVKKTGKAAKPAPSTSAGVAFYAGASAIRATAGNAAEVTIVMDRAMKDGTLPSRAEVSGKNLRKIGYSDEQASAKATAYLQYETLVAKLEDENYLKGFGNNGGEEFISYMLSSESIVITGDKSWGKWNEKMHNLFEKIQNADGSWSGHHCISSPVLCTAAVLLTLTADREVHVLVETGPPGKTAARPKPDETSDDKPKGPTTGK